MHFIPFLIILIAHFPHFFQNSGDKIRMFEDGNIPPPLLAGVNMFFLWIPQFFLYLVSSFLLLHRKRVSLPEKQYKRLRLILLFYLIIFLCFLYFLLISRNYPRRDFSPLRLLLDFPIFIICAYYYFLLMSGDRTVETGSPKEGKYKKSGLLPRQNNRICENLCRVIEEGKLWTDPSLDLRTLAEKTGYTYHNLSQAINQTTGLNYHAFINRYRIEEACRLLENTEMNILDIAFEAGFNSKATFNTVFKKEKACTPTQYRNDRREKPPE